MLRNVSGDQGRGVVGLVADPGLSTEMANRIAGELPRALSRQVSDEVSWKICVTSETTPLDENGDIPLVEYARAKMAWEGWDLMVCLTDLARYVGTRPVLGEFSTTYGAAQVSLPATGWLHPRRHVRDTVVYLIQAMTSDAHDCGEDDAQLHLPRRPLERVSPVRCVASYREGVDAYLAVDGVRGRARLLFGMVRTNRPWRLVTGLARASAAAAAVAAFGIFFSTVWSLADAVSPYRLAVVNVLALTAMVGWLTVYHNLWERSSQRPDSKQTRLFNASTVLTLSVGVVCMYVVLFVVILGGAAAVISPAYLQTVIGHPVGPADYAALAWLSASLGIVAGALGSGLETEAAVRRTIYSRREYDSQTRRREQQQGDDNSPD